MSKNLLKKAFNLYYDDFSNSNAKVQKYTGKQGMKNNAEKLRKAKALKQIEKKKALKHKKTKSVLEEFEKKKREDHTKPNIMFFKALSASSLAADDAQVIFKHNRGKLSKNKNVPEKQDVKKEETLFTDEDFENFDKDFQLT